MDSPDKFDQEQPSTSVPVELMEEETATKHKDALTEVFTAIKTWYGGLSSPVKLAVGVLAFLGLISLVTAILRLVATLFSILILAGIGYGVYRFLIAPQSQSR
ncbi:MAG: hypothetical protein N5P05_003183 [Chroococcopsis gigantea SAG 12.99]|jgi:nucleoside permease NupC|nr:hypothetical protein [Chlorogloea purpurea SAG 13.99]MDV3001577.1 hypothetical protein [Chroococcopsis gigantea SAG 12.99]